MRSKETEAQPDPTYRWLCPFCRSWKTTTAHPFEQALWVTCPDCSQSRKVSEFRDKEGPLLGR